MNTTELIRHWSMAGGGQEDDGGFRSPQEFRALFERDDTPSQAGSTGDLLFKLAGEQEWRPLLLGMAEGSASA